jgi:hypothetical protein
MTSWGNRLDEAGWPRGPDGTRSQRQAAVARVRHVDGWQDRPLGPALQVDQQIGIAVTINCRRRCWRPPRGGVINSGRFDVSLDGWIAGVDPDDSTLWM